MSGQAIIRAIVFDAVGTLLHPEPPAAEVYAEVGCRHGSRLGVEDIRRRSRAAFDAEERRDRDAGLRTSEERERLRWRAIVAAVLTDVADFDSCFHELFEHFRRPGAWRCAPGTGRILAALQARGLGLGLASNYDRRLFDVAAGLPELACLDHVVISSEVGWRKPSRRFFEKVCAILRLPAAEILHVGDDPANDYEAACQAGLAVALSGRSAAPPDVRRAEHLEELLPLLRAN